MTTLETQKSAEFSSTNKELADLRQEVNDGRKGKDKNNGVNPEIVGEVSMEYSIASTKLQNFMSASAPDATWVEDRELRRYHFDTVNWWRNVKPHPRMVVKEVKTVRYQLKNEIDEYLKSNPARILDLQKKLNERMSRWVQSYIDYDKLDYILKGTWMDLERDTRSNPMPNPKIREDGKLWPQTYAAICCIKDDYRVHDIVKGTKQLSN